MFDTWAPPEYTYELRKTYNGVINDSLNQLSFNPILHSVTLVKIIEHPELISRQFPCSHHFSCLCRPFIRYISYPMGTATSFISTMRTNSSLFYLSN